MKKKDHPTPSTPVWVEPPSSDSVQGRRWNDLVQAVGEEIGEPLTAALERIHTFTSTGQIDRAEMRALRRDVETAREVGIKAQQIARLGSGRVRQAPEPVQLTEMLQGAVNHRSRDIHARGILIKPKLRPVEVVVDASLLFGLLNTVVDWSLRHARSSIELWVDVKSWPRHAVLSCRYVHSLSDEQDSRSQALAARVSLDSLTWRLIEETARVMGLPLQRHTEGQHTLLSVEFPHTSSETAKSLRHLDLDQGFSPSTQHQPVAGNQVLVVGARRELRAEIKEAIKDMGLVIDLVSSVNQAVDFCTESLPHAVIFESALRGDKLRQLQAELLDEVPDMVFIEILEEGNRFETSGFDHASMAKVGRGALATALPSVLVYELSNSI
ncbi:MAG: hypothetical protein V4739_14435 [Pseudomonadota bacterium]